MNETDYNAAITETLAKLGAISKQIEGLEIEAAKLRQFFAATLNMLPDDQRADYLSAFRDIAATAAARETSLKKAIHHALLDAYPKYLTATTVRDRLHASGFDFTDYASNPLASVSTTLRRFKPQEVESTQIEGVTAYRMAEEQMRKIRKLARKLDGGINALAGIPLVRKVKKESGVAR